MKTICKKCIGKKIDITQLITFTDSCTCDICKQTTDDDWMYLLDDKYMKRNKDKLLLDPRINYLI